MLIVVREGVATEVAAKMRRGHPSANPDGMLPLADAERGGVSLITQYMWTRSKQSSGLGSSGGAKLLRFD